QQHDGGEDAGGGVDRVQPCDVGGRAVDGLVQAAGAVPQRGGGDHPDGTGDHGGLVREDVAEHIFGDDDVELGRVLDDLHGAVVHEHLAVRHVGVLVLQPVHHRAPQAAGVQHVGLVHAAQLFAALAGRLKADAADPLDLVLGVGHDVHRLLFAAGQGVGAVLAKVDAAGQLPHDDEVDALGHDLGLEGAGRGQLGPDFGGAAVGVQAHPGPQPQQALFGALGAGQALPLGAAHRPQQDAVGGQTLVQLVLGQRVAVFVDGLAAHGGVDVVEGVAELFGYFVQHPQGLADDLGAGAVAPD